MQGIRTNRWKRIIKIIIPILVLGLCILADQLTKFYFKNLIKKSGNITVIPNFFYFTYTVNTGAAWSFLAGVSWSQIFFKVLTGVALIGFGVFFFFALKKEFKWLSYSLALIIGGTLGNFIDRLAFDGVTDFIGFTFGSYNFPIFNLADSFLVVGLIMLIIHYAFLDENAIFKKSKKQEDTICIENETVGNEIIEHDCETPSIIDEGSADNNGNSEVSD